MTQLLLLLMSISPVSAGPERAPVAAAPVVIVVPVMDADGAPLTAPAPGPDADAVYPVVRIAPDSPRIAAIREALAAPHPAGMLRLDRHARNLALHTGAHAAAAAAPDGLREPRYLLLSSEDGGFARHGFWLEEADGRRFVPAGYVVMLDDPQDVRDGGFEETFLHELAHLTLHALFGPMPPGWSPKMHMSMAVTDYPTAFDEGFAIHTQPITRARTGNARLARADRGETLEDGVALWHSRVGRRLRSDGVRRNLFVHDKPLPPRAFEPDADRYRLFLESETSPTFAVETLRTGQQMMASEGVVATLFHRFVHDERIRTRYREPDFYQPFLSEPDPALVPERRFSPLENAYLKLYAAIHALARTRPGADSPLMARLVETYGALFPDEREAAFEVFVRTTHGATVSTDAIAAYRTLAAAGVVGDLEAFAPELGRHRRLISAWIRDAVERRVSLDAAVGPELWILNEAFLIAPAVWQRERTVPLAVNLNTATAAEWMTLPGVDATLARRIVEARARRGFFPDVDALAGIDGVGPELLDTLHAMRAAMSRARRADRV